MSSSAKDGVNHALFLKTYSAKITLMYIGEMPLPPSVRKKLQQAEINLIEDARAEVAISRTTSTDNTPGEWKRACFRRHLPDAGGNSARSELATALGARRNKCGNLIVDRHQRTTVPGLYAAGDVVNQLSQISVAMGHAAIAATEIHNWLKKSNLFGRVSTAIYEGTPGPRLIAEMGCPGNRQGSEAGGKSGEPAPAHGLLWLPLSLFASPFLASPAWLGHTRTTFLFCPFSSFRSRCSVADS